MCSSVWWEATGTAKDWTGFSATMPPQLLAIIRAQFQITRNHFPRTSFGTVLSWTISTLWHMLFVILALVIARSLQHVPDRYLSLSVSAGLFAMFVYIQVIPLVTTSSGWSLQLDKLQAFPISSETLFLIEVVLRVSSAPEMLLLLCGAFLGLELRTDVSPLAPFCLLLFVPFCLLLQLTIRDFILHSFARNRFREIITVLFLALAVLPQLLVRESTLPLIKPYALLIARGRATPWNQTALASLGESAFGGIAAMLCWNAIALTLAYRQFMKSLRQEDSFRPAARSSTSTSPGFDLLDGLTRHLPDPLGALVEKELRTLVRMPRFRVLFGMASIFSILVFLPMVSAAGERSFIGQNVMPVTSLYGLLLLSDALLLNIFGFDRAASQLYFTTPPALSTVIRAKNMAAVMIIAVLALAIPLLSMLFRIPVTWASVTAGILASAVVTVFLLSAGNMLSVFVPRPIDPRSAFRKQGGSKVQMWLLFCTLGMFLLVGFAFLARWASDRDWVLLAVLGLEFAVGIVVYCISLDSTIEHALANREQIVADLSKSAAPLGSD